MGVPAGPPAAASLVSSFRWVGRAQTLGVRRQGAALCPSRGTEGLRPSLAQGDGWPPAPRTACPVRTELRGARSARAPQGPPVPGGRWPARARSLSPISPGAPSWLSGPTPSSREACETAVLPPPTLCRGAGLAPAGGTEGLEAGQRPARPCSRLQPTAPRGASGLPASLFSVTKPCSPSSWEMPAQLQRDQDEDCED